MNNTYLVALGSNLRVRGVGPPRKVIAAAFEALADCGFNLLATSPIIDSAPVGPSLRRYANAVAVIETDLGPPALLNELHRLEARFGRSRQQRRGARWRARALDLDIVLWSGGVWASPLMHQPQLCIPHPLFRQRDFVLGPATTIAGAWRDPLTGLSLAQLNRRLTRPRPLPR